MPKSDEIVLPINTVDLRAELIPAVRQVLGRGVSDIFLNSSMRIGSFDVFSEGLKAQLVGRLRADLHIVIKLGDSELLNHVKLMEHVNLINKNTFPVTLHVEKLASNKIFILTEECRKYVTLLDKIFREETENKEFDSILKQTFERLKIIHSIKIESRNKIPNIPITIDPFTKRLRSKLDEIICDDPELRQMLNSCGYVDGTKVQSLSELLDGMANICLRNCKKQNVCLTHGDPHVGNIMVRRNGPYGYRVRLIDPNPNIGFSQPIYDIGKLLHWVDRVGFVKVMSSQCQANFTLRKSGEWILSSRNFRFSNAANLRREYVEEKILKFSEYYRSQYGASFASMLAISRASAHIGMANILKSTDKRGEKLFILTQALKYLKEATS